jgi:hypothetical protein
MAASNGTVYVKLSPDKRELSLSLQTTQGTVSLGMDKRSIDSLIRHLIIQSGLMKESLGHD